MTRERHENTANADIAATANRLQFEATAPDASIWVNASAGSGKTKVLAERVLRLMLPRGPVPAARPSHILCITFTRAAAAQVLERIMRYLREWTVAPDADLAARLEKLLGRAPDDAQMKAARALFARVLEAPGGMKIMTIHAFCQSVLARFPMEAGLPAGFEVMDEGEARALMVDVRHGLIAAMEKGTRLEQAFTLLATLKSAGDLEALLARMAAERGRLFRLLLAHGGIEGVCAAVDASLGVQADETRQGCAKAYMAALPLDALRACLPLMAGCKSATNKKAAALLAGLLARLAAEPSGSLADLAGAYAGLFYTFSTGNHKKPVGALGKDEAAMALYAREAVRAEDYDRRLRALATARATGALLRFSLTALERYESEKRLRNRLDYEDLIDRTRALLQGGGVHWVHYKLDGGIDHVLVDEAQDTNPEQWDVITALYDEFYDGTGAREPLDRTTFVVGDEKQSIFSFQRADPRVFGAMRDRLERRAGDRFREIPMRISFRSAPSVLGVVDAVFAQPGMTQGVSRSGPVAHSAFHSGRAGRVELWPLLARRDEAEKSPWALPESVNEGAGPVVALAQGVARRIRALLDDPGEMLESAGRRVEAGDIMILVNRRRPMADALLKALRASNVPVNGIDRMVVSRQLAVMDVLCVLAFILQPEDDLNLAALLKTPFIALDEESLYRLCAHRGKTPLWSVVRASGGPAAAWLSGILERDTARVSALLHGILYAPCPADGRTGLHALMRRLGHDVRDPLQELLARADAHDASDRRGLQGFVEDARRDEGEIKRQLDESGDRVRLMTVHGSKGLEAPIVFLPDTVRASGGHQADPILWPDRDEAGGVPLWSPESKMRADALRDRAVRQKQDAQEEYRRLLYVALTRAGERLYIAGADKYAKGRADRVDSWYMRCAQAFEGGALAGVETLADGTKLVRNRRTGEVRPQPPRPREWHETALPAWALEAAPAPEMPPRPLMPSRPDEGAMDPAALSPLAGDGARRFARGRIIHTLFQFLPDLPEPVRLERARAWLALPAHNLDSAARREILDRVTAVLADARFAPLFSPRARAEVPLTGLLAPHRIVSGQVDRLLIETDSVMVVDYKTNRPAPKTRDAVPGAYVRQMAVYHDLLRRIWPEKEVRCALLWTDGPALMDITDILSSLTPGRAAP